LKKQEIAKWLRERVSSASFQKFLTDSLMDLCLIDNTPQSDLRVLRANEDRAIKYLGQLISRYVGDGVLEERSIKDNLQRNLNYIRPYYTESETAYQDRKNLLHFWKSADPSDLGLNIGLNAHLDTVSPHIEPSVIDGTVFGRGACDDKGGCINIVASLILLKEIERNFGISPGCSITTMFVIDEETGGNGSLSLSLDEELLENIDTMIVLEPTDQQIHPANRGALWYKVEIPMDDVSEAVRFLLRVVLAFETAGRKIKEESNHKLFPQRPVQTCQGVFGPYGEHPSRVCDEFELIIRSNLTSRTVNDILECGLEKYIKQYGENDSIKNYFHIEPMSEGFLLKVSGRSGHMAAADQLDNAIVKAAYLVEGLSDEEAVFSLPDMKGEPFLVLEGGQGFLPTHTIQDIEDAMKKALDDVVDEFVDSGRDSMINAVLSFNKLRNAAFAFNPESESMKNAITSAELSDIPVEKPITGFPASCDARLFAMSPKKIETLTVGPGCLADAHSNSEKISINDLSKSCSFLTLFILLQTGAFEKDKSSQSI